MSRRTRTMNRRHAGGVFTRAVRLVLATLLLAMVLPVAPAQGHEGQHEVVSSEPANGSVIATPPSIVTVEFDLDVVPDRSSFQVISPDGTDLVVGDFQVDGSTIRADVSTDTVDGIHRILYDVTLRDSDGSTLHSTSGSLRYTISSNGCHLRVKEKGGFTSVAGPAFGSAPDLMTFAVPDKVFPWLLYATNGRELQRSTDGGCSWDTVLDVSDGQAGVSAEAEIVTIATPREIPGAVATLVLDPIDAGNGVYQPTVFWSAQPTQAMQGGGTGLPPVRLDPARSLACDATQPCQFDFSEAQPDGLAPSLYFLAKPAQDVGVAQVFRSDDLGATFTVATGLVAESDPTAGLPLVRAASLAPSTSDPNVVYVSTGRTIHVSTDKGETFTPAYTLPGGDDRVLNHLTVGTGVAPDGTPRLDVLALVSADAPDAPVEEIKRFLPDGTSLVETEGIDTAPLRGAWIQSVARGSQPGQYLLLPEGGTGGRPGIFEYERALGVLQDLDNFEISPWRNAATTNPICSRWFGHDDDHLYLTDADDGHTHTHSAGQFCTQPDPDGDGSSIDIEKFPSARDAADGTGRLAPGDITVQVDPGRSEAVGYRLTRAAESTPLDVAFLFDSSGSMQDNIKDVRDVFEEIVAQLSDSRIDAWFGLAEFDSPSMRYRRLSDVRPPDDVFATELAELQATGSGGEEPTLTALYQLATGEGISRENAGRGAPVTPGQQMNWRPDAVRVVILATDEQICTSSGPDFAETIEALVAKDIHHIGLHVPILPGDETNSCSGPLQADQMLHEQLQKLSVGTDATAVEPVDCDGDGRADLRRGDPLVCTMPDDPDGIDLPLSTGVASALTDLVQAVKDERPFRLIPDAPAGFSARVAASGLNGAQSYYPAIDVKRPQNLRFGVTFSCTANQAGTSATIPLKALLGDLVVAEASATVRCGPQPGDVPAPTQALTPIALAVPPPPAPPPPATITAQAPASASQAASSSASAAASAHAPAGAAAVAPQMEVQTQKAELRTNDRDQLNFTALRPRRDRSPAGVPVLVAGLAMAGVAGALELRRRRTSGVQQVRVSDRSRGRAPRRS